MTFTLNSYFQVKLKKMIESEIDALRERVLVKIDLTEADLRRMQGEHSAFQKVLELMDAAESEVLAEQ